VCYEVYLCRSVVDCCVVCSQDEDSDRSQATAWSLATFFRHIGYTGFKNHGSLDRCPYFNAKDRKIFKFTKAPRKVTYLYVYINDVDKLLNPTWFTAGGAIRIAHYDVIDDVITRKL